MNHYRKFKLNDVVECVSIYSSNKHCKNKIGKVIHMHNSDDWYLIEFFESIKGGHDGDGKGKDGYCRSLHTKSLKLYLPILKLFLKEKNNES